MSGEFVVRLRANSNGVIDLAGNSWTNTGVTNTGTGKFGGNALTFATDGCQLYTPMTNDLMINSNEDFTISLWTKVTDTRDSYPFLNDYGIIITPIQEKTSSNFVKWRFALGIGANQYIFNEFSNETAVINEWIHLAMTRQNGSVKCFYNGTVVYTKNGFSGIAGVLAEVLGIGGWGASTPSNRTFKGLIDDICYIKGESLWDDDFTPPNYYLSLDYQLYKDNNNKVYGFNNGTFGQVVADWTALSDSDKETALTTYGDGTPTAANYAAINAPFTIINYAKSASTPTATMTAVPPAQVISPTGLIPINGYAALDAVTATVGESGNGEVRMAITTDLTTYKVYDSSLTAWTTIATEDIPTDGMTATQLAAIPSSAWASLNADGIGVAYSLSMDSTTDTANVDALSITVDFFGELESRVQGTDYDYSYLANNVLHVKLYKSGDFKINYNPGT